jgi:hypothetical protein
MKTLKKSIGIFGILFLLVNIPSCFDDGSKRITGNGDVVKQEREISPFNSIDVSGVFNVYFAQGDTESLVIEADKNLIPYLKTKVEENTLYIDMEKHINIRHAKKKDIYITLKDISRLKISAVGNIKTKGLLQLKNLELDHSGVGNLELEFNCEKLTADIHSVGEVKLKGKVTEANIKNSSVGNTDASELIADKLEIDNSSVGNVEVHAEKEISINSSGVGNLTFSGNAEVKHMSSSSIGKVRKK